jgi:hypothetical protein
VTVRAAGANDGPKIRRAFLNLERDTVYTRFETDIESGANRRTRLVAFGATMPNAMAGRTSRFAAATLSASFYTDRLHRPRRRECKEGA